MSKLKSFVRGDKSIVYTALFNSTSKEKSEAMEEHKVTSYDTPLDELDTALGKLRVGVCTIMAIQKEWAEGLSVHTLRISETKHGTRAVQIGFKKPLDTIGGNLHDMETPFVKIDKPADGESGDMVIDQKLANLIKKALHECERYVDGERAQGTLNFAEGKAALQLTADKGQGSLAI